MVTCPTGCGRTVGPRHLLCSACWREVPKHLREEVYRTWRKYRSTPTDDHYAGYLQAREAALGSIR